MMVKLHYHMFYKLIGWMPASKKVEVFRNRHGNWQIIGTTNVFSHKTRKLISLTPGKKRRWKGWIRPRLEFCGNDVKPINTGICNEVRERN